jgi:hypothetical protein
MFEVGDVLKVINGRRGERYRVIEIDSKGRMILRNIHQNDPHMNFRASNSDNLELDEIYYRRKKLDNIRDNIDSLNIMKKAKEMAELNQKVRWLMMIEERKRKIQKIKENVIRVGK